MLLFNILSHFGYKHYSKINNNIYIGNINTAQNTNFIKNNNITTIINCSKNIPFYYKLHLNPFAVKLKSRKQVELISINTFSFVSLKLYIRIF